MKQKYLLILLHTFLSCGFLPAQSNLKPVIVEAESGQLGSDWQVLEENEVTYVTSKTNFIATSNPGSNAKVITFTFTFPEAGEYHLYAKFRVGPATFDDDSFFAANSFGEKSSTTSGDWIVVNNLAVGGVASANSLVTGEGDLRENVWKWLNVSAFLNKDNPVVYHVNEDNLTVTFQIGGREDGLDLDKMGFGRAGIYYTVRNLENGEDGSTSPPEREPVGPPLADGQSKFLGSAWSPVMAQNFDGYWNQVSPENEGKWGHVEGTRNVMNWGPLDRAYNLAKDNGYPFRMHVMIWGAQQPRWMFNLPKEEQLEEIKEWFALVAERYPDIDMVEVVNEPLHQIPDNSKEDAGNYLEALGGVGETGWDWVINSFKLAREYFPTAELKINDYGIVGNSSATARYLEIIKLLQDRGLIDAIGVQAHAFTTRSASASAIKTSLDNLAATGLKVYATELDIDGPTDAVQLQEYQRVFPVFWDHPKVTGITLWGYRPGMWRTQQRAYLIDSEGQERPAMQWLRAYVQNQVVHANSITINSVNGLHSLKVGETLQFTATIEPENATIKLVNWTVEQVSGTSGQAVINEDGILTATSPGQVKVRAVNYDLFSPALGELTVEIQPNTVTSVAEIIAPNLIIFPNPSKNGSVTLKNLQGIRSIAIADITGKVIMEKDLNNESQIHLNMNLKPGVFIVKISDGKKNRFEKLVVK